MLDVKAADAANSIWGQILAPNAGPKTVPKLGAAKCKHKNDKWISENVAPNWEQKLAPKTGV